MNDERPFLRQLLADPNDLSTRLVYADWLEERGECERAEFLRLECELVRLSPTDGSYLTINERYHELHGRLDPNWLAQFDRTGIDNCRVDFNYRCPLRWERLKPTGDDRVRQCDMCRRDVYHCSLVVEARDKARLGHCVAIDSRLAREPGDLEQETECETVLMGVIDPDDAIRRGALDILRRSVRRPLGLPPRRREPLFQPGRRRWWQFWK